MSSFYSIPGPGGTVQIGTVTTVAPGDDATVSNRGTDTAAILDFEIPQGDGGTVSAAGAGSASTPSITFASDPNTGIYSPGADQLAISTNGTGRLFVDASGNVGFGVSSPERPIHLSDGNILLLGTTAATGTQIQHTASANFLINNKEAGAQIFYTNDTERLRITSDGKLGLGTSSPQAILSTKPSASTTTAATTFTGDGVYIDCANTTDSNGSYGGAISWSRSGSSTTRAAAICNVQTAGDSDVQGLAFLTHASTTSTNPLIEAMRIKIGRAHV